MEIKNNKDDMLDLIVYPVFLIRDGLIQKVNHAAQQLQIPVGTPIQTLLLTGQEEYAAFTDGCLYVSLMLNNQLFGASITRTTAGDVFTLEKPVEQSELQALALAARELRSPLSDALIVSAQLSRDSSTEEQKDSAARLTRKLYQMLRLIGNMSDAGGTGMIPRKEMLELDDFFREVFEKVSALTAETGVSLTYRGLKKDVATFADGQLLERAALNMISNALKFTQPGGQITAELVQKGHMVHLRVSNDGEGIPAPLKSTLFQRYLRQPTVEDSRYGMGLGMLLIRNAAAEHGGAVLVDQPEKTGVRVTMTIKAVPASEMQLRSRPMKIDYGGELDHTLIELADVLPPELYHNL